MPTDDIEPETTTSISTRFALFSALVDVHARDLEPDTAIFSALGTITAAVDAYILSDTKTEHDNDVMHAMLTRAVEVIPELVQTAGTEAAAPSRADLLMVSYILAKHAPRS